jgi:hypothetical protein
MNPDDFTEEIPPTEMRVGGIYKIQIRSKTEIVLITERDRDAAKGLVQVVWTYPEVRGSPPRPSDAWSGTILSESGTPGVRAFKRPSSSKSSSTASSSKSSSSSSSGLVKTVMATMIVGVTSLVGIAIYRARTGV